MYVILFTPLLIEYIAATWQGMTSLLENTADTRSHNAKAKNLAFKANKTKLSLKIP